MREIKFRIWCKQTDEMHTVERMGFEEGELWYVEDEDRETQPPYFMDRNDSVLMQYTGLKDKNGREIYESDILKDHGDEGPIYVEYSDEHAGFIFVDIFDPSGREVYTPMQISYEAFEVIGNIYRNPELLEENK